MLKFIIGLGLPYSGVLVALPWVASTDRMVFGIPFVYAWMFSWFLLTSGCLLTCWTMFDRHTDESGSHLH